VRRNIVESCPLRSSHSSRVDGARVACGESASLLARALLTQLSCTGHSTFNKVNGQSLHMTPGIRSKAHGAIRCSQLAQMRVTDENCHGCDWNLSRISNRMLTTVVTPSRSLRLLRSNSFRCRFTHLHSLCYSFLLVSLCSDESRGMV
jgi:hypothetical protein